MATKNRLSYAETEIRDTIFSRPSKGILPDIDGEMVVAEGGRAGYYYIVSMISEAYNKAIIPWIYPDKLCRGFLTISENHNLRWFMINDKKSTDKYFNHFISNPDLFKKIEKFTKKRADDAARALNKDLTRLSIEELKESCCEFFKSYFDFMYSAGGTMRTFDRCVRIHLNEDNTNANIVYTIFHPKKISFSLLEEIEVLKIAVKVRNGTSTDKEINDAITKIWKKFCFSQMGYYNEPPKSIEDYKTQLDMVANNENPAERLRIIRKDIKDTKKEKAAARAVHNDKIKRLADAVGYAQYLKDLYKYQANRAQFNSEKLFKELNRRTGIDAELIKDLTPNEMLKLLDGEKIDWHYIRQRANSSITVMLDGKLFEKIIDVKKFESESLNKRQNIELAKRGLKGRVSYQGLVRGIARIVLNKNEFHKLQKGDILIVMNTSPDFVPILRKINGIVAEEGGLTAHVNIISREFKIPCVVGVTGATTILKDGELIELNAMNGTVRRLK